MFVTLKSIPIFNGSLSCTLSALAQVNRITSYNVCYTKLLRYPEHSIRVYPDSSGKNRHSSDASTSDIALLEAQYTVDYNKSNPLVKDRVMSANKSFQDGIVKVNAALCPEFARCLEQLVYDVNGNPDKKSGLDHLIV